MVFFQKKYWLASCFFTFTLVIVACFYLKDIQLSTSFEDFFPKKSQQWTNYNKYTSIFGDDHNKVYLPIYYEKSIFDTEFVQRVGQFTDSLRSLPITKSVISPTHIMLPRRSPFGTFFTPLLNRNDADKLLNDSIQLKELPLLRDLFFSGNEKGLLVIVTYQGQLEDFEYQEYFSEIKQIIARMELSASLMGNGYLEIAYKTLLQREMVVAGLLSFGVILVALLFLFRNGLVVLLSTLTIILSIVIFYGSLGFFQWKIGILGNLFPTIILVLGISDSIHFLNYYGYQLRKGYDLDEAIRRTIRFKGMALFYTSFTTFVGFITLSFASMPALQQFGWQAGYGVLLTFLVTIMVIPGLLSLFKIQKVFLKPRLKHRWYIPLYQSYRWMEARPKYTVALLMFICLLAAWGIFHMNTNNPLITSIPRKEGIKEDYSRFEREFGGYRSVEWMIRAPEETSLLNTKYLEQLGRFNHLLSQQKGVSRISSPYEFYVTLNKMMYPNSALKMPDSTALLIQLDARSRPFTRAYRNMFLDSTNTIARVVAVVQDNGRIETEKIRNKLQSWIEDQPTDQLQFEATGRDLLIDEGHKVRIKGMFYNLLLAVLVVIVLIGGLFKSWRMALAALLANIVPLLLVAAIMGLCGIELRGTSSIIFIVGFVVAVDDTIHFLAAFWKHYRKEKQHIDASLKNTFKETGQAIIWTSFTLVGGFMILQTSSFWDIWAHGVLISLMVIFALLMDLILLPIILKILLHDQAA